MTHPQDHWQARISRHDHVVVLALLSKGLRLHDARDLSQEAWTRLIEADRRGRLERVELPGLAIRQAMFLLSERRRGEGRRPEAPLDDAAEVPTAGVPDAIAEARQHLGLIAATLEQVPPRGREVLSSHLSSAEGHVEQAARIGLSVQRFRQVLCEVRARLREALGEDGP